MSSSLDKLRALTSRLEEKLEEKVKKIDATPKEEKTSISVAPVKKEAVVDIPLAAKTVSEKTVSDKNVAAKNESADDVRAHNIIRVKTLYEKLKIFEKSPDFDTVFAYKAMNLSGIGLKEEDFGAVREGKYIQIIAITYEPDKNGKKKAKNISLGYFGKSETLNVDLKNEIIEFVLRWRYEKAFQNVAHYKNLIARVDVPTTTLF